MLTRDDLLILAIEECAEVTKAVTKCQRFGFDGGHFAYGVNKEVLAAEVGDLMGIIDALMPNLDPVIVRQARESKIARAIEAKQKFGGRTRC